MISYEEKEYWLERDVTEQVPHGTPIREYWCSIYESRCVVLCTLTIFGIKLRWWRLY